MSEPAVSYRRRFPVTDSDLQSLGKEPHPQFASVLEHSFIWITAHVGDELVGYVNVAWDGGVHFFLLDPIVRPDYRHQGIGTRLVTSAIAACEGEGNVVHVDAEKTLMREFYEQECGFEPTAAGLVRF